MLYLASRSARRNELLTRLGATFRILDLEVPEVRATGESAEAYVRRVALDKACAGLAQRAGEADAVVLGADTEVVLGDRVFGKPADAEDAAAMLAALSGRTHQALTVVALVGAGREELVSVPTAVTFAPLSARDIADYVASGEPMGCAGAYAIQGVAERFVSRLDGSYSAVMGLPLHQTFHLLRTFGVL